ncbi:Malonyl CoA-acyl carrier protein transacylase [Waddlia chondrophila 2032/99]|uniref:Malonyl CoA-acyl carrier protein transacylase n=2 Tax=Waddlia chondrophila TaxID=71667 RepID=D6YWN4_WADCW|nr:ACP S-malonyltransferase [Waddlia chondrophila]ADI38545.1 malonyl CoA-acyl carrier protein transacylase [Waddlia chondrophila WSU 86-1044]CCB91027.1 Malonyl CoA-acyl carrier protein transacylase [Waddlia chondrophila 2032/99]
MKNIAFLFPGQGAQYPGMGKDFYESYQTARAVFEEANERLNRDLASIILNGPEETLTETRNSQVGIYVVSIAILRVLSELFPEMEPSICAGLSLGEYTAATSAGYLSFDDGLPLVQARGQFMNEACESTQGAMAVILGLSPAQVEQIVKSVNLPNDLWAANFNCPGQVVVSGTRKGIDAAAIAAKSMGAKRVLPLQVHGAFHSGLMLDAQKRLAEYVNGTAFGEPKAELVMNVTGEIVEEASVVRDLLISQVSSPVKWQQGIETIEKRGIDLYVEMGPGKALAGFNKRIGVQAPTISVEKIEEIKQLEEALRCGNF